MSPNSMDVKITDSIELISQYQKNGIPCILLLNDSNENQDISCARYCAYLDEEDKLRISDIVSEKERISAVKKILGDDYINLVWSRFNNQPVTIASSERIVIRELTISDVQDLYDIYEEIGQELEPFFDNKEDANRVLDQYIKEVYDFYGFGIWGVELTGSENIIGIVGFTPRDSEGDVMDIELGYAIRPSYQRRGYAMEAAHMAIEYASKNIEYGHILIKVKENNIPGQILGEKLKVLTSDIKYNIMKHEE